MRRESHVRFCERLAVKLRWAMSCATNALTETPVRYCTRDEGRSLGAGWQEQASNHLKLLW